MRYALLVSGLVVAAVFAGCEESVDPIVGTDKAFSMYGVLQPRSDTQWVRVYPIEDRLAPTPPESLAATVTSTEGDGGASVTWQDSLIQEDDGRYAHVFWRPFRVEYDRTYRLQVAGDGGETTTVEVPVPENAELVLQDAQADTAPVIAPVLVNNDVPRLINVEVEYYFQYDLQQNVAPDENPVARLTLPYSGTQQRVEDGWVVPVDLSADFETLREALISADLWNPNFGIVLGHMTLRLSVVNEAWDPPGDELDAEVLVEPGAMSNVDGGFGFVGAGYRLKKQWTPTINVLQEAGWSAPGS